MSLINGTSTSAFLYCTSPPATQTFYTTIYETVLPAACETSQWMATYTITETCAGSPADYVTAVIPPGFVVTTVSCPSCNPDEIEITCPGAQPTGMGKPTVAIGGNGVTATITATPIVATPVAATPTAASPIGAPGMSSAPAAATGAPAPVVTAIVGQAGIGGSVGSSSSCGSSGCVGVIGTNGNNGNNGSNSSIVSGGNNGATGSGSSSGSGNMGGSSGSSASNSTTGITGTAGTPPVSFTGAGSSLTRDLALVSGLALISGYFFLL
ncbi:hypothetical protein F4775DRAFT_202861 [Biscogniauxia sp. FL1348]|nr:hypothetical protein F4775DRAFT_202861 [Biscogniauxia sp. FL1348]